MQHIKTFKEILLYTPLSVPSRPWGSILMDLFGGSPITKTGFGYFSIVMDRFSKIGILIPCKKIVKGEGATKLFLNNGWKHFGLPTLSFQIETVGFLIIFESLYGAL